MSLSEPTTAALIPAAGRGERLGRGPKAFLPLGGAPLLAYSVAAFEGWVDELIVAVSPDMMTEAKAVLPGKVRIILGGATRQQSVYALLHATDAQSVLIHDAARPFLPADVITKTLAAVTASDAASVVRPVADSLIRAATGEVIARDGLRAVQTPQAFERELILAAHEGALADGISATDDAALVRRIGHEVALVEGSAWLLKITTPADYELAQALVGAWRARA